MRVYALSSFYGRR